MKNYIIAALITGLLSVTVGLYEVRLNRLERALSQLGADVIELADRPNTTIIASNTDQPAISIMGVSNITIRGVYFDATGQAHLYKP